MTYFLSLSLFRWTFLQLRGETVVVVAVVVVEMQRPAVLNLRLLFDLLEFVKLAHSFVFPLPPADVDKLINLSLFQSFSFLLYDCRWRFFSQNDWIMLIYFYSFLILQPLGSYWLFKLMVRQTCAERSSVLITTRPFAIDKFFNFIENLGDSQSELNLYIF